MSRSPQQFRPPHRPLGPRGDRHCPVAPASLRPAFTLMELLVVLAIVAVLISLLLPALANARYQANNIKCASNVRQITMALINYASDFKGCFPPHANPGQRWYDVYRLGPYLRTGEMSPERWVRGPVVICPNDPGSVFSYSMNFWASSAADSAMANNGTGVLWRQSVKNSSKMILISEGWSAGKPTINPLFIGNAGATPGQRFGAGAGLSPMIDEGRFGYVNCQLAYYRHRPLALRAPVTAAVGRINIGYADGHVALKAHDELADPKSFLSRLDSWWTPIDDRLNH